MGNYYFPGCAGVVEAVTARRSVFLTDHPSLITYLSRRSLWATADHFERAVSSAVEHLVYTEEVGGSKPSPPILLTDQ